jgi:hypothetical protein
MQPGQLSLATAHGRPRQKIIESVSISYGFDGTVFLGCQVRHLLPDISGFASLQLYPAVFY